MVICYFSGAADEKVRGNQPRGSSKLSFATLDLPHHRPMLQVWICTRPNVPLPDRAEVEAVWEITKRDRTLFLKGRLAGERDLRFKAGLIATRGLEAATDTVCSDDGRNRATRGGGGGFEDRSCLINRNSSSLELHGVENLLCHISPFCVAVKSAPLFDR